jgi:hypothetical protein
MEREREEGREGEREDMEAFAATAKWSDMKIIAPVIIIQLNLALYPVLPCSPCTLPPPPTLTLPYTLYLTLYPVLPCTLPPTLTFPVPCPIIYPIPGPLLYARGSQTYLSHMISHGPLRTPPPSLSLSFSFCKEID